MSDPRMSDSEDPAFNAKAWIVFRMDNEDDAVIEAVERTYNEIMDMGRACTLHEAHVSIDDVIRNQDEAIRNYARMRLSLADRSIPASSESVADTPLFVRVCAVALNTDTKMTLKDYALRMKSPHIQRLLDSMNAANSIFDDALWAVQ